MYELRPYQLQALDKARLILADPDRPCRRLLLESPTGSGKTVVVAHMMQRCAERSKKCLFLMHTRELIGQASEKLTNLGVHHGVIMAGVHPNPMANVQVASKDTLHARAIRKRGHRAMELPKADLVIVDECHRSVARTWRDLLAHYPQAVVIGLTATPCRMDGRGLGDIYQRIMKMATYQDLIRDGFLVKTRVFSPPRAQIDKKGVETSGADYNMKQMAPRAMKSELVGNAWEHWEMHAQGRPTLVFCVTVEHAMMMRDMMREKGLSVELVHGSMDLQERDSIYHRFRDGQIDMLTNCLVFTEGVDLPRASCVINARPTKSLGLWRQIAGRIQRPYPGKDDAVIIDMTGAVHEHGFPDEDMEWVLEPTRRQLKKKAQNAGEEEARPKACPSCGFMSRPGPLFCPECGALIKRTRKPKTRAGSLSEVRRRKLLPATAMDHQQYWDHCLGVMMNRDTMVGAAGHMYRQRFGVFPRSGILKRVPSGKQWKLRARQFFSDHCVAPATMV